MSRNPSWLGEPMLQQFLAATRAMGGEARIVGGAVRDFLMGKSAGDLDLASTLTPEQTMELASANGWKAIPTGLAHGTVTVVLPGRVIEVTTLRRDVETDGRHAKIEYTDTFEEDAARRDFTFNALYMDAGGEISDFFGGKEDLKEKRVKFIGDSGTRIAEDGLRILRYFRFLATHGSATDASALEAIKEKRSMIEKLSGERIAAEMIKLLSARDPLLALRMMEEQGVPPLLTQESWHFTRLEYLFDVEKRYELPPNPWVRLWSLISEPERKRVLPWLSERWKVSVKQRNLLRYLTQYEMPTPALVKEWLRAQSREEVVARILLAASDIAETQDLDAMMALARNWQIPTFPVTAGDLIAQGFREGLELGEGLRELERKWVESDYTLGKDALLQGIS